MGIMNPLKRNAESLEKEIKKAFEKAGIEGFHFYKIFLPLNNVEEKVKKLRQGQILTEEEECPFILIRPLKTNQKYKNGECKKVADYLIRIGTKNEENEEGFFEVAQIAEYLIAYFTHKPSAIESKDGYSYSINLENMDAYLNEEITGGDYWIYDIVMQLNIPAIAHGDYYTNNLKII
ncbi:hypothetical protein MWG07_05985 [Fusobacterium necrophorum]|uniref:Uncharacterized protein n=1 Tax=Fusobacterium necrophorum TaxID=859 RepID=A0AAW6WB74_9FUSO|nr:hypothetical protein [Fusobacterium necrophorum]KYM57034.1 hypothetical protein A2U07_01280 [Fusobacterium necrophorum subsp. funduliforme]MCF0163407.1 hypothetical protein [Fusobacterium necrophorum]MDK4475020.1 hypothetical protein [Fusobacterium necrophorum]MDK4481574.1 hypothetical protein [Fusobacterium necrophorum]MDK4496691.1 hypothetical protein [Fusobacterium necrophorum]